MDVTLFADIKIAGSSDELKDTVCYSDVHKAIHTFLESRHFVLIETIAENCAALVLKEFSVQMITIQVRKPAALKKQGVEYSGVEITRT